ncbi:MAG: DVUA0089 family protein [Rubricella sp.]
MAHGKTKRLAALAAAGIALGPGAAFAQDLCGPAAGTVMWTGGAEATSDIATSPFPLDSSGTVPTNASATWAFTVSSQSNVRIQAVATDSFGDPVLTLTDANGMVIASNDDFDGLDSRIETALAPGTYCAQVAGYAGSGLAADVRVGRFEHEVLMSSAGFDDGFDGGLFIEDVICTPETEARLLGEPGTGEVIGVASASEAPFYRFTISEPRPLTFTAENQMADPLIRVFDGQGNQIAENDDYDSLNSRIDLVDPLPAGTYCVSVSALSDQFAPITLEISEYDEAAYLASLYDSGDAAPPLDGSHPVSQIGAIGANTRQDIRTGAVATWVAFEVPQDGLVVIDAVSLSNGDPVITLYDDFGRQVAFDDDGGEGFDSQMATRVSRGTYLLAVEEYQGADAGANRTRLGFQMFVPMQP